MVTAVRSDSTRRMPRAQRREQILEAATRAFARGGFANTGLDAGQPDPDQAATRIRGIVDAVIEAAAQ